MKSASPEIPSTRDIWNSKMPFSADPLRLKYCFWKTPNDFPHLNRTNWALCSSPHLRNHEEETPPFHYGASGIDKSTVGTGSVMTITGTTRTVAAGATNTRSRSGSSESTARNAAWGLQPSVPVVIGSAVVLGFYMFLWGIGFSKHYPTSCISI